MRKPTTPQAEPATDEQLLQAGRYFSDLLRKAVGTKGGVQQVLANFGPLIAPQLRPLLLRASGLLQVRTASRLDLLRECEQAGITLCGTPEEANYGESDPKVEYEVLNYDLAPIFALRDAGQLPWNGNMAQQDSWGKGIRTVQQNLQAILDHHRIHGHVPDPDRYWWLRCSDPYGFGHSRRVRWHPVCGLELNFVHHDYSNESGGALAQELPSTIM